VATGRDRTIGTGQHPRDPACLGIDGKNML
jgi:hypothetical protein